MNTPWILDEVESELVAELLLTDLKNLHENGVAKKTQEFIERLLAQYCGPRKISIDYKEWKFVRLI